MDESLLLHLRSLTFSSRVLQAALLALKADMSAKESNLPEQDCVEAAATTVTVKVEIEEPVINPCRECGKSCTFESDARPSNIRNQEPKMARDVPSISKFSPVASKRNFESVKVEHVTSGSDAAHRDKSRLDDNSSKCIFSDNAEFEGFFLVIG